MKKILLLTLSLLLLNTLSGQEEFDITFYPSPGSFIKTIYTSDAYWPVFQKMIWRIDRETAEVQTYHITELIDNPFQYSFIRFADAVELDDDRAMFFTSSRHYIVLEGGQLNEYIEPELANPVILAQEGGQLIMAVRHGSQVATFDLTTRQMTVGQLYGDPMDYSRRLFHIDEEGYHWIASINRKQIHRYKDGETEQISDQLPSFDQANLSCHVTRDDQLAIWWDKETIYAFHDGQWTTIELAPFDMQIYRSVCTDQNTMLLFGARKVLAGSLIDGQVKVEDISDQYSSLALASIQLTDTGDGNTLYYQKSTQELWRRQNEALPQKVSDLPLAPYDIRDLQKDKAGRIWCMGPEEPYLLVDEKWIGLSEIIPASTDGIQALQLGENYAPLVLQRQADNRLSVQAYSNGQWHTLNPAATDSPGPRFNYERLYHNNQGDVWALDRFNGFSLFRDNERFDYRLTSFFPAPFRVYDLYRKDNGQLLFCTDLGLFTIDGNGAYELLRFSDLGLENIGSFRMDAQFDSNGAWWFISNRTIFRYHEGEVKRFPDIDITSPFNTGTTYSIFPISEEEIWVIDNVLNYYLLHFDGQTWSALTSDDYEMPFNTMYSVVATGEEGQYLASGNDGIFKITRAPKPETPTTAETSFTVFPNPTCCTFTVEWEQGAGEVNISLHNALGQEVRQLFQRSTDAGTYRQTFDRQGLEAGTYFLQIREEDRTKAIPLIIH